MRCPSHSRIFSRQCFWFGTISPRLVSPDSDHPNTSIVCTHDLLFGRSLLAEEVVIFSGPALKWGQASF